MVLELALGAAAGAGTWNQATTARMLKAVLAGVSVAALVKVLRSLSRSVIGLKKEPYPIEAFHANYEEDAVEPELAILDAHHHMWDPRIHDKGWPIPKLLLKIIFNLKPELTNAAIVADKELSNSFGQRCPLVATYMGPELAKDIKGNGKGHKILGTVYIECGWKTPGVPEIWEPVKEADMVTEEHKKFPSLCNGIIPHADLRWGAEIEPVLKHYSQNPLIKGVRHGLAWTEDHSIHNTAHTVKDMALDKKFQAGVALLGKYNLTYDSWLFHDQIDQLAAVAKACPGTTVICDHMGFPLGIGNYKMKESWPQWKVSLKKLAENKNVYVKVGGMGMRFFGFGFDERDRPATSDELAEAWRPFIIYSIETFGVDRVIMESNYPMDKISCSYTVLWNALKKVVKGFSMEDKKKMFEMNARKVYRL